MRSDRLDGSGRSSIALSLLASAAPEGACAYIDVGDTFSPRSAAAAGVELANLLWVRFTASTQAQVLPGKPSAESKLFELESAGHRPIHGGCGSSHPRGETKGLAPALEQMLFDKEERRRRKVEGTPGHPNQALGLHTASQDQVEWERWNLRKVDETDPLRQMDLQAAEAARLRASSSPAFVFHPGEVELATTIKRLLEEIERVGPARLVIDSLAEFRLLAQDPLRYRRQLLALKQFFAGRNTTVLLLDDLNPDINDQQVLSIVHGVIR